jgi:CMP-N-acetylneuraminic acid synthetase
MSVLCIIPARGGSKRVPQKNTLQLLGKPIMGYVIEAAKAASRIDRIVVSTEDEGIAAVGRDFGVEIVDRPAEYAADTSPIDPALRHAVRHCEKSGERYEAVVWLQANVPTTRPETIDAAIERLLSTDAESVATVLPYDKPIQWAWRLDGDDRMTRLEGVYRYVVRHQDSVIAYHYDGAVIAMRRDVLMDTEGQPNQAYMGERRRCIIQSRHDSVEIDHSFDLMLAETILRYRASQSA